jgi:glycosyltransferase involved in cell wall biosynthesis
MTSVLIDARLSWSSGIGRYVANQAPRIAAWLPDVAFELLVPPDAEERARAVMAGCPNAVVRVTDVRPFSAAEQTAIGRFARAHDLTWFTNYWVPLTFGRPYVAAVHDMLHQEPALFPASRLKRELSRLTFRHVARTARGVFYASRFTRREFERRYGAPRRSVVSSYGVDHGGFVPFAAEAPPAKRPRLLLVAARKVHKNFAVALEAFGRARLSPDWRLTLVIPDQELRSSIDLDALVGGSDRVDMHVGISDAALQALYAEAAVVLMPSFYEGFGLPLAEAMQAGARPISSTAEALVEVGQGADVTYVNPRDREGWTLAIEAECGRFERGEVTDGERRALMAHAARYRWDDVSRRTLGLLQAVLAED